MKPVASKTTQRTLASALMRIPTTTATEILWELGIRHVVMKSIRPLTPIEGMLAGRARTLRFLPLREDIRPKTAAIHQRTVDELTTGDVLVIDALGNTDGAVFGDMLATRARVNGTVAVVADGAVRDLAGLASLGLPVFARSSHPDPSARVLVAWEAGVPIHCGGCLVVPNDWILADADGILVIPSRLAAKVATQGAHQLALDEFSQRLLSNGSQLAEAYPIPPGRRDDAERFARDGVMRD